MTGKREHSAGLVVAPNLLSARRLSQHSLDDPASRHCSFCSKTAAYKCSVAGCDGWCCDEHASYGGRLHINLRQNSKYHLSALRVICDRCQGDKTSVGLHDAAGGSKQKEASECEI